MKHSVFRALALGLLLPASVMGQAGTATSVTLFNSGRVLVRRTVPVAVPNGTSTLPLALGLFDPASLMVLEPGVRLNRIAFDGTTGEDAILRRHVGEEFTLYRTGTTPTLLQGKLLALQPERWLVDGAVVYGRPGQIRWEPSKIPTSALSDLTVTSDRARNGLRLLYGTSGASWSVGYQLILGNAGRIEGNASIMNGALEIADAEVQLLAGEIGQPMPSPVSLQRGMQEASMVSRTAAKDFGMSESAAVGEARIYTLPGRVTFLPGTQTVLPLFEPTAARAERRYTVSGAIPFYGGFGQQEDEQEVPVAVAYRLERKLGSTFGDLPLPAGGMEVYEADQGGRLQLIGMGGIGHTAPGEELLVTTGNAFDVTARRTQTAYTTQRSTTPNSNRTTAYASFRVDLQNAKDSAVVVEVREDRGGDWSVVESSVPGQRRSASRTVFPVTVPAKGKATLTYRVRVVW